MNPKTGSTGELGQRNIAGTCFALLSAFPHFLCVSKNLALQKLTLWGESHNQNMFSNQTVDIIGVPFGLGGKRQGAQLGPAALRLAGLESAIGMYVKQVRDKGDVATTLSSVEDAEGDILNFGAIRNNLKSVKATVAASLSDGSLPFILGGDHSLSIGSIAPAIALHGDDLGVLWIDAHVDYNTPDTSPSGNLHGMPVAAICGFDSPSAQWQKIRNEILENRFINPNKVVWFGLREPDIAEANRLLLGNPARGISMYEIDRYGLAPMIKHSFDTLMQAGVKRLWVSFDVDTLDPILAPGTGTEVRGGLTYREMHLLAEMLHERLGVDVVEVNPILDRNNETAKMAVEWLTSLLGKRIMPAWKSV